MLLDQNWETWLYFKKLWFFDIHIVGIVSSVSARKLKCPSSAWLGTFIARLSSSRKIPARTHHYKLPTKQENNYRVSLFLFKFFQSIIRHPVWESVALHWRVHQLILEMTAVSVTELGYTTLLCRHLQKLGFFVASQKTECKYVLRNNWILISISSCT